MFCMDLKVIIAVIQQRDKKEKKGVPTSVIHNVIISEHINSIRRIVR